jgi:hypothetical protein
MNITLVGKVLRMGGMAHLHLGGVSRFCIEAICILASAPPKPVAQIF